MDYTEMDLTPDFQICRFKIIQENHHSNLATISSHTSSIRSEKMCVCVSPLPSKLRRIFRNNFVTFLFKGRCIIGLRHVEQFLNLSI